MTINTQVCLYTKKDFVLQHYQSKAATHVHFAVVEYCSVVQQQCALGEGDCKDYNMVNGR